MYLNTFINLEENINGYGKNSRKPSGHTIITMPGMVRLYLQDLKDLSDKEYICYALSKKDNKAVRLGVINAPSENKMTNWRIDINNVAGKGIRADNVDCIAVVIEGDTVGNTDTVMVGYVGEKYLITPILEKGLPKKEKEVAEENRKDKTATVPKTEAKSVPKVEPKVEPKPIPKVEPKVEPKPIPKVEPKVEPKPMPKVEPKVEPKIEQDVVIVPKPCESGPVVIPQEPGPVVIPQPIPEGPGPVVIPQPIPKESCPGSCTQPDVIEGLVQKLETNKPKEKQQNDALKKIIKELNVAETESNKAVVKVEGVEENSKPNEKCKPKKECGCNNTTKKDKACKIKEFIERLESGETNTNQLSEVIEMELKELINQGVSREEILDKKNELEEQIKDLMNNKMRGQNHTLEDKLKEELNKQFDMGYHLSREGKDENNGEQSKTEQMTYEKQTTIGEDTTKEEIDFLEQLEDKLKGLQTLLKTNVTNNLENDNEKIEDKEIYFEKNERRASGEEMEESQNEKDSEYARVKEIFETSSEIEPFETQVQPIDWVRISLAELISIPQLSYEWATQPFITFSYHKFNHLILGKDREIEQYYIGIPDIYHQTRGHILEIDKIERFVCRSSERLAAGEPGYWIAMI